MTCGRSLGAVRDVESGGSELWPSGIEGSSRKAARPGEAKNATSLVASVSADVADPSAAREATNEALSTVL